MDASALDEILNWMDADGYGVPIGTHERKDAAREELAALRARVEDLELIARGFAAGRLIRIAFHHTASEPHFRIEPDFVRSGTKIPVNSDGTGLPLLTAEARRALRVDNEGKVST